MKLTLTVVIDVQTSPGVDTPQEVQEISDTLARKLKEEFDGYGEVSVTLQTETKLGEE